MSQSIAAFQRAKADLGYLKAWRSLIGKEYGGGGGGIGSIVSASATFTVYHQEYNGANNYHDVPSCQEFIDKAAKCLSTQIIDKAIELAEAELSKAAADALKDAQEVLEAAKAAP